MLVNRDVVLSATEQVMIAFVSGPVEIDPATLIKTTEAVAATFRNLVANPKIKPVAAKQEKPWKYPAPTVGYIKPDEPKVEVKPEAKEGFNWHEPTYFYGDNLYPIPQI